MVRVKVRFGVTTPEQLEALADVAERFTPNKVVHVTTRQDFQFHYIKRRDIPQALLHLAGSGLTTREACGNSVRNVTACHLAGISPTEAFDVTPYADALSRHLLRNSDQSKFAAQIQDRVRRLRGRSRAHADS